MRSVAMAMVDMCIMAYLAIVLTLPWRDGRHVCSKYHGDTHTTMLVIVIINPRRACAARVTVVILCVRPLICDSCN